MKKKERNIIESVSYEYVGTDKQFNEFLKSVIRDYVSEDRIVPTEDEKYA